MKLLAVDPGLRTTGYALFNAGELVQCGLWEIEKKKSLEECVWTIAKKSKVFSKHVDKLIIEIPQIYRQRYWMGDPNDLITVAIIVGTVCGCLRIKDVVFTTPSNWKGQVPKNIHNKRVLGKLTKQEVRVLNGCTVKASLLHNTLDAIGVGLWYLRR